METGFLWQAGVSESLTANVTEFLADAGAEILDARGRAVLGGTEAERAFSLMADLTARGVSPRTVATYKESDSQDAFANGRGLFLRNWSYAWVNASNPKVSRVMRQDRGDAAPGLRGDRPLRRLLRRWLEQLRQPQLPGAGRRHGVRPVLRGGRGAASPRPGGRMSSPR